MDEDKRFHFAMALFWSQAVFGALAVGGLIAAAVAWSNVLALALALGACCATLFSHSVAHTTIMLTFAVDGVGISTSAMAKAKMLWYLAVILAILSLLALI